jgi:hypothetical protein
MIMEADIKGSIKIIKGMERGFISMSMGTSGVENGKMVKDMVMVYYIRRMEGSMQRSGMMERKMSVF